MHKQHATFNVLEHEVNELRLVIERQTGILVDTPTHLVSEYMAQAIESRGLKSAADLIDRLRESDKVCETLLELLLDGNTAFFVHPNALNSLSQVALPELVRRVVPAEQGRALRMWSAGCATGEEIYSIAITVCETMNRSFGEWQIRILGSDIRQTALKIAERGLYSEEAVLRLPRPIVQSYFAKIGEHYLVKPRIRNMVSLTHLNLAKMNYIGRFHCIFCMDVLPRFSQTQRAALAQRFHLYLEPGGFLFLGEGERLPANLMEFQELKTPNYTLYRKPMAQAASGSGK